MKFKNVFVALAIVSVQGLATAGTIAYIENEAGGKIRLTDDRCKEGEKGLFAISTSSRGSSIPGCWQYIDGTVVIKYSIGETRIYEGSNWIVTPYGETVLKKPRTSQRRSDV